MKLGRWSTAAASNNTAPPDGWPEGQAPSTVNDCAREMMAAIRAAFSDLQYFDQDFTPTYVSATSFTVPGDQTSAIHAGRRLKLYDATAGAATVIYATVATASFTVVTTVNVANDAGQLTSSLSSFAIAILSRTNSSFPKDQSISALAVENLTVAGTTTLSGATVLKTTLTVSGAAVFNSTVTISGAVVLNSTLSVSAAAQINGLLTVDNNIRSTGNISAAGAINAQASIQGNDTLSISGAAVFKSRVDISATCSAINTLKVWARLSVGATPTIVSNVNASTVSRSAAGVFRVTFTNAIADALYSYQINADGVPLVRSISAIAASVKFSLADIGGTALENTVVNLSICR